MAKKPQTKAAKKKGGGSGWMVVGGLVFMTAIIWYSLSSTRSADTPAPQTAQLEKPTTQTLSPEQFEGKAREAYQVAKDIPAILAKVPCFCGCMKNMGHTSNLDCFSSYHGVDCEMCMDIALDARDMYKAGDSIERIREKIIARYSSYAE